MTVLNNLRNWYAGASPKTQAQLSPLIDLLPLKLKYGRTFFDTRQAILTAQADPDFTREARLQKLRELMSFAAKTPYYQSLFHKTYGGIPDIDRFTFEALRKLPILTKEDLRNDPEAFLAKPKEDTDVASTSGSSGRPLQFFLDKDRGVKELAYVTHFWSRIGFEAGKHTRAVFRGIHFEKVDDKPWYFDAALKELRLSPFHFKPDNMELFCQLIEEYKADFIHGYPSSIIVFARYVLNAGWEAPRRLKGILPVSEATQPHQLETFQRAFPHAKIMKYYGMSEKVLIAGQVGDDPNLYDVEPLYGYGELVDEQGDIITEAGQSGRIIGTGFLSMAMPLLRYDTEDIATLVHPADEVNHYRARWRDIQGRWGEEYAVGKGGELTSMSAINIHSPVYAKLHAFQLYQDVPGEVSIRVVPQPGVSEAELRPFVEEIQRKNGESIRFTLQIVDDIPFNTANGKRTFINQKLNLEPYR